MPLPSYVANTDTFFVWLDATNNLISHVDNTAAYLQLASNSTPRVSTANATLNGTFNIATVNASSVNATGTVTASAFSGNGASLTSLNANQITTGTISTARLTSANTSANGVVDTTTQTFAGAKTFQNTASFSNTVSITGAANALSTFGVNGVFTASGNSTLTGAVTMSNTASITGASNALSTFGVGGVFSALGNSSHTGAATFSNTVSVTGAFSALSTASISGATNVLSTLGVTGTFTASGLSTHTGNATFNGGYMFLASGAIIDWNSADVRLTHSADKLQFSGATSGYQFDDGSIGINTPPSAWGAGIKAIDIGTATAFIADASAQAVIAHNAFINSVGNYTYKISNLASRYEQGAGEHRWYTAATGTANTGISFTSVVRFAANGNVGIGNTAPAHLLRVDGTVSLNGATNALSTLGVTGVFTASANSTLTGAVTMSNTASITGAANALSTFGVGGAFSALSTASFSSTVLLSGTTTANATIKCDGANNGRIVVPVGVDKWSTV